MFPVVILLFISAQPSSTADENNRSTDASAAIASLITSQQNALLNKPDFSGISDQIVKLYQFNHNQLLWLGPQQSDTRIQQALTILEHAAADGLLAQDYDTEALKNNLHVASSMPASAVNELAQLDTALSIALVRFLNDLHAGRVNPQQLNYPAPFGYKTKLDIVGLIMDALDKNSLTALPERIQPKVKQYQQLKQVLASYRQTPQEANFQPLIIDGALRPGQHHPQLADLQQRLIALGALPEDVKAKPVSDNYDIELQAGVKKFQQEIGLKADGVIGKETATKLNESLDQKILRIELAMERLRWLPDDIEGPLIIVNIPAFQLWAFNSMDDTETLNMRVIVGKALQNQTPVLFEQMEYLEFMPYWNIPRSIMDKEILPKLYNDFSYLQSQNMELVNRSAPDNLEALEGFLDDIRRGRVRARQRPGSGNPLGKVKFIFPNKEDVYLHDTSNHNLFNRSRRDFSHGCVRVAEAEKLAEFVLNNQPESAWDLQAIQEAMSGSKTRRVTLKKPIPVLFLYATSFVDHTNKVHFYNDIYQQDAALEKALGKITATNDQTLLSAKTSKPG
ncbi:MAG: hypothetical protein CTY19_04120 [Methylomonas sp.]|nr:MAG: hypothetical protein CTY19_04120 [Methylomonas sp.]